MLEPLFGVYKLKNRERHFYSRGGQLFTRLGDSSENRVFAAGNDRFFYGPDSLNWFEVKREASGAHRMEMHQGGVEEAEVSIRSGPVRALAAVQVPLETLERYAGNYRIDGAPVIVALGQGYSLTIQLPAQKALPMRPTSVNEFAVAGQPARVIFNEEKGKVVSLVIKLPGREMKPSVSRMHGNAARPFPRGSQVRRLARYQRSPAGPPDDSQ